MLYLMSEVFKDKDGVWSVRLYDPGRNKDIKLTLTANQIELIKDYLGLVCNV